ncbi:MAG: hypothetical protein DPW16_10325 [Chloroflexi bacterium]|nr:hypothetical protein [Chloroflexota bacterium]
MTTDIVIITALQLELQAVLNCYGPWSQQFSSDSGQVYYQCSAVNNLQIVATCALGMGQINGALLAKTVIADWHPKGIILVGITGGLSKTLSLGDIVISEQIVDYELGKVTSEGLYHRWSVYRSDAQLLNQLSNFRDTNWVRLIHINRPDSNTISPKVHVGVVLSGNKVIADENVAYTLRSVWNRALAVEMESAGIAAAIYQTPHSPSFIIIKGICDYADSSKNDLWQPYAAAVAAAYTIGFLMSFSHESTALPALETEHRKLEDIIEFRILRLAISAGFDIEELKVMCADLGIDWEEVAGKGKTMWIVELIKYVERRSRIQDLLNIIRRERPGLLEAYL